MKNFRQQQPRPKKNTLVVGRDKVLAALNEGTQLEKIYMQANVQAPAVQEIKKLAAELLVPIHKVPVEKLNNLNVFNHEGVVGQLSKIAYQNLSDIIPFVVESGETPLFIVLDGITDIRNIGAIARSAYAMGVHAIVIPEKGVGALNEDAILTSAGALEKIAVCRVRSLMEAVEEMQLNGITVFASEMTAEKNIFDCDFTGPAAIVLGGEEKGIYPALIKICNEQCRIPMPGDFESLNVSVANGIILYEVAKQRMQ